MGKFAQLMNEALKKVPGGEYTSENGRHKAVVHRDAEWDEYRVQFHKDGVHQKKADYHTDDKEDAHSTAKYHVNNQKD
jgi:outer membrane protein assembly factor BamE (lipoprotein component of BamABCDE complex)